MTPSLLAGHQLFRDTFGGFQKPPPTIAIPICRNRSPTRAAHHLALIAAPTTPTTRSHRRRRQSEADLMLTENGGGWCRRSIWAAAATRPQLARHRRSGRDVVARRPRLRISVLFGLTLTIFSSITASPAACRAISAAARPDFQRLIEVWNAIPSLYLLLIIRRCCRRVTHPAGICCCSHWVWLVGLVRAEFLRGRNFEYIRRPAPQPQCHDLIPAICCRTPWWRPTFLPFIVVVGVDADGAGFPRLRSAAGLALARRIAVAGQGQRASISSLAGFFSVATATVT